MSERETVITLTPNPALDVTMRVTKLVPDSSHRVTQTTERLGGKGINVAEILAAEGVRAIACGPVEKARIPVDGGPEWLLTPVDTPLRRSIAVIDDEGGATLFNERGAAHPAEVWQQVLDTVKRAIPVTGRAVVTISGSFPPGVPDDFVARLVDLATSLGAAVIADVQGPALLAAAHAGATWLKPNEHELREAVAAGSLDGAAAHLLDLGAQGVLVSRGEEGMTAYERRDARDRVITARLDEVLTGNPTGAGDAAVAALARHLATEEDNLENTLRTAVAWSASAVLQPDAGSLHPTWHALRERVVVSDSRRPAAE